MKIGCCISTIISLLVLIFAIIFLVSTGKASQSNSVSTNEFFTELAENWSQDLIYSMNIREKDDCEANESNLLTDEWPGYVHGCLCNNNTIYRGYCYSVKEAKN